MAIGLKKACFNIWNSNFDRMNINNTFKPLNISFLLKSGLFLYFLKKSLDFFVWWLYNTNMW